MINIFISGCNGKMGRVISALCKNDDNVAVTGGYDLNADSSCGYPVYSDLSLVTDRPDVIIDFSNPAAFDSITSFAVKNAIPAVICTTGLSGEQREKLKVCSAEIPVFFSANMSIGVNLITELSRKAARLLGDAFDIEIIEKHHNQKVDAPSGTALAIADALNSEAEESYKYVYDRHSVRAKRTNKEIGIHAVRGGTIVGEHEVIFAGTDEIITISHSARSKEIFAVGAIKAAKYLADKLPGMYDMNSLINEL